MPSARFRSKITSSSPQNADRLRTPAAEDKKASGKRIGVEVLVAELRQRADAFSAIDGFDRPQNAELRRDLDSSDQLP
jgi:hypothetical protein